MTIHVCAKVKFLKARFGSFFEVQKLGSARSLLKKLVSARLAKKEARGQQTFCMKSSAREYCKTPIPYSLSEKVIPN